MVSLHAIKGSQGPHTMRLEVIVGTTKAIVLVDLGSTHNFLGLKLENMLSLPVGHQKKFNVTVADGRGLMNKGTCRNVTWKTQGFKFIVGFILLQLNGCDMVLGLQWLLFLGFITWNFNSLTMSFAQGEDLCTLRGIQPGSI